MPDLHIQRRPDCTTNANQLDVSWFQLSVRAVEERFQLTFVVRRGRGCAGRVSVAQRWIIGDPFVQRCLGEWRSRGDVLLLREAVMVNGGGSHDCNWGIVIINGAVS